MRALVVGADGTIGAALAHALRARGDEVEGTTRRPIAGRLRLDLADPALASVSLPECDVVYLCAAMTGFAACRAEPELAHRVNVAAPLALARRLAARGSRIVFLSSSAVFDGTAPQRAATAPVSPRGVYGRMKAEAEAGLREFGAKAAVLRLTKVVAPDLRLFRDWIDALARGGEVVAFTDLHIAPIALDDAVAALLAVGLDDGGGVYQLSGATDIGYDDAAMYLAKRLGANPSSVRRQRAVEAGLPPEETSRFDSLDSGRVEALTRRAAPESYAVLDQVYGPIIAAKRRAS